MFPVLDWQDILSGIGEQAIVEEYFNEAFGRAIQFAEVEHRTVRLHLEGGYILEADVLPDSSLGPIRVHS